MTYRGTVRNGVVVFDEPAPLEEGAQVEVQPVPAQTGPRPGTPEAMQQLREITWAGDPEELRELAAQVQAMREADLTPMNDRSPLDDHE